MEKRQEVNTTQGRLTCHEAMDMEEWHDNQRLVLGSQLIGGYDVGQTGC